MDRYQKNYKIIEERFPDVISKLKAAQTAQIELIFVENENKDCIPFVKTEQGEYRLNSYYEPLRAAELFAERYAVDSDYKVYAIAGLSDGKCIRQLLQKLDDTNIVLIYEPDAAWLDKYLEIYDYTDIFSDTRVKFFTGSAEDGALEKLIVNTINYAKRDLVEQCILPNYDILFPKQCEVFIELLVQRIKWLIFQRASYEEFGSKYLDNLYYAIPDMMKGYTVDQLVEYLAKMDISNIPAIIVSAGPSLDKNIHLLKEAKGKALIIVVDAAMRSVVRAGVQPDLVVSVDPVIGMKMVGIEGIETPNFVVMPLSARELIEKNQGKHFYHSISYPFVQQFYWKEGKGDGVYLASGGSVANDAFSLAVTLGFRTIVFIGQDLAFTGGRVYTKGIEDMKKPDEDLTKGSIIVTVEGIHGEELRTDIKMEQYLRWFEREIKKHPELEVIDATEGGARIQGTILKTFQEVLDEKCIGKFDMDAVTAELEPVFTKEQQENIHRELCQIPKRLEELKVIFHKGIAAYDNLNRWAGSKKKDQKEYDRICQEIAVVDEEIAKELLIDILTLYNAKENYETDDVVFAQTDVAVEELAVQGKALLESYCKAADDMIEDLSKIPYYKEM